LELNIDKVVYVDYSQGPEPVVKEYDVNIHERHANITNPQVFAALIVSRALFKTSVASLANFDIGAAGDDLKTLLGGGAGSVKDALSNAASSIKNLFGGN